MCAHIQQCWHWRLEIKTHSEEIEPEDLERITLCLFKYVPDIHVKLIGLLGKCQRHYVDK